ncbi:endonuclease/exonuclease/phosphatase family protein [Streptomyces sp. NPDC047928]|uniref:endonuclease/exonuclease/phosphatase family protein n=1 Tax=unclassified Streptomyces TaxID=2593676 RepID=UPI00371080C1
MRDWGPDGRGRSAWGRGHVLAALAVLVAWLVVFHGTVPDLPGRPGSLIETFLPWLGLAVPVLLAAALLRRSATALLALVLPVVAWLGHFGAALPPGDAPGPYDLVAVQHNVSDENPDPAGTVRALTRARPDLIALEELTPAALPAYAAALAADYPHHAVHGTVGLWSRHPLSDVRELDIRPDGVGAGWNRGMRATAATPHGEVAVLVAHLPSVRLGLGGGFGTGRRDQSAALLGAAIGAEKLDRLLLLGDLNGTVDDRGLGPVGSRMDPVPADFAFSWPASAPVARIDHVMARGATITRIRSLPRTGSDHLPVVAYVRF